MKRYEDSPEFNFEKRKEKSWKKEHKAGGFRCSHCKQYVVINDMMGTANRNHCNICLWSKHVDEQKGDRKANCHAGMEPIGLTLKHEGTGRIGEIMLIHLCSICSKISINRIARDDLEHRIVAIFEQSFGSGEMIKKKLFAENITLLTKTDTEGLQTQLFGKI